MDQFETNEGKILYLIYNLYKSNRIGIEQRNEIKDMLISNDSRITKLMEELGIEGQVTNVEAALENLSDMSPRDFDDSMSNTYKNKRPTKFKFLKSNFPKHLEFKANEDTDALSRNSNQQVDTRRRVFSQLSR